MSSYYTSSTNSPNTPVFSISPSAKYDNSHDYPLAMAPHSPDSLGPQIIKSEPTLMPTPPAERESVRFFKGEVSWLLKDIRVKDSEATFIFELGPVALKFDDAKRLDATGLSNACQDWDAREWYQSLRNDLKAEDCILTELDEIPGTRVSGEPFELVIVERKWLVIYHRLEVELTAANIREDPELLEHTAEALERWDWSCI